MGNLKSSRDGKEMHFTAGVRFYSGSTKLKVRFEFSAVQAQKI